MDKDYCRKVTVSQAAGSPRTFLPDGFDLGDFRAKGCRFLPDNTPNQYFCFQDCAIGQVQPKGGVPDLLVLGVGHEEINRIVLRSQIGSPPGADSTLSARILSGNVAFQFLNRLRLT